MGNDIQKGITYATGGVGGQGVITSSNLNAHVDDAIIKSTFISAKVDRGASISFADNLLLEAAGVLYRANLGDVHNYWSPIAAGHPEQTVVATPYTANADLAVIPADDTVPLNTEGTQILSLTITTEATSKVRLIFNGWGTTNTAAASLTAALFRGTIAIQVASATVTTIGYRVQLSIDWLDTPASGLPQTYTIRAGASAGLGRMNGTNAARQFGGTSACTLTAMELR